METGSKPGTSVLFECLKHYCFVANLVTIKDTLWKFGQ